MISTLQPKLPSPYKLVFTNRHGGISEPPYDTLNLGFHTGDHPSRVLENRRILCQQLGIELDRLTLLRQVHSTRVVKVGPGDKGGGSTNYEGGLADADAMVSICADAVLCVLVADCLPLAIYATPPVALGLVHAGWKGTLGDLAGKTVATMVRELSVDPTSLYAIIGPCIRSCCYLVDGNRAERFMKEYAREEAGLEMVKGLSGVVTKRKGAYYLDLPAANRVNLVRAGVPERNIVDVGVCTCCNKDYFSFRRDRETGRQAALLYLEN